MSNESTFFDEVAVSAVSTEVLRGQGGVVFGRPPSSVHSSSSQVRDSLYRYTINRELYETDDGCGENASVLK